MNYHKRSLIDLFARVQAVQARPLERRRDCLNIQEDLLRMTSYLEKEIKSLRAQTKESKALLAQKGAVTLSKTEAGKIKEGIERNRQAIEESKDILYLLKSIGDALAFIYIPKWDVKPMAFKEEAGFVSDKDGLQHELKFLRAIFEVDGALAILNDLTNSLRYGDLTIISERFSGPIEVKAGPRTSRRAKRQQDELEKMVRYLAEDRTEELYGLPGVAVRSALLVEETNHVNVLNRLIDDAYRYGFAFLEVEEGLYYWVVVPEHFGGWNPERDEPGGFGILLEQLKSKQSMIFSINEAKFGTWGRYPYTLSIKNPRALFNFYCGRLIVQVIVDTGVMSAKFASYGLKMTFVEDENIALILTNTDPDRADRFELALSRHFFERLAYEFLSLEWFVEENARRTDLSRVADHELSALQVAEVDHLGDDSTVTSLSQIRQLALHRRARSDREGT